MANIPVFHTSTHETKSDDYRHARGKYDYGRKGTPHPKPRAVADLYRMEDCVATHRVCRPYVGHTTLKAGDHALFPDSMYGSGRRFIDQVLPQMGVSVGIYDPYVCQST